MFIAKIVHADRCVAVISERLWPLRRIGNATAVKRIEIQLTIEVG